jgi:hypothetical protein
LGDYSYQLLVCHFDLYTRDGLVADLYPLLFDSAVESACHGGHGPHCYGGHRTEVVVVEVAVAGVDGELFFCLNRSPSEDLEKVSGGHYRQTRDD